MTTNPASAAPPDVSADTSAPPVVDTAPDLDALRAAAAELAEIKARMSADKVAEKEARKKAQADAEAAGELAKALDAAKARLAELEPLEPLAGKWRAFEAEEAKRLDGEAASLNEAARDLYASAVDLDGKRKVLAAFKASTPATPSKGTPPSLGAPAGVVAIDMDAILADKTGKKAQEAKARDPQGFAAAFKNLISGAGNRPASSLGIAAFQRSAKAPNA